MDDAGLSPCEHCGEPTDNEYGVCDDCLEDDEIWPSRVRGSGDPDWDRKFKLGG